MSHQGVLKLGLKLTSVVLLSGTLVGCAYGEMRQVLRAQVASEADCPELQISKVPAYAEGYAENQYKVLGCGIDRLYTCNDPGGLVKFGDADCKYVAAAAPKPAAAPAPADEGDSSGGETGDELGADDNG
jgi:hypothetical protein